MSEVDVILAGFKNADTDQKILAIDRLSKLFDKETAKDCLNGAITEECVTTVASFLKAPQMPLCLKAISITGPMLTYLITASRPLKKFISLIIPSLIERLGDGKERMREAALSSLIICWEIFYSVVKSSLISHGEKIIDDFSSMVLNGMKHKTPRIRELCVSWCLNCAKKDNQFPLSKFASPVLLLAEDTIEAVREKAKDLLFNYYPTVSQESRNSLQRAMTKSRVKKSLADQLTAKLIKEVHDAENKKPSNIKHRQTASGTVIPPSLDLFQGEPVQRDKASISSVSTSESRSSLRSPLQPNVLEPLNVYDAKDLQKKLSEINKLFSGKETDQNWDSREQGLQRFRQILRGNSTSSWPEPIISFIKDFMEPLNRTLLSVRTALVFSGLNLVSDLSTLLPNGTLDSYNHLIFPTLLKCAASTKKSQSELAHATTMSYLNASSYHLRTLTWICDTTSDKGAQTRVFGLSYLLTFLELHGKSRPQLFEKKGLQVGTELIAKALKRSLSDANPKARDLARQSFYFYREVWPNAAHDLVLSLDSNLRKNLTQGSKDNNTVGKTDQTKERPRSSLRSINGSSPLASSAQRQKQNLLPPSSSRIPLSKSSLSTTRINSRPSSAMLLGSERRTILSKEAASTTRSPSSLGASRKSVIPSTPSSSKRSATSFGTSRRSIAPITPSSSVSSSRQEILSNRSALNSTRSPSALGLLSRTTGSVKKSPFINSSLEDNDFKYSPPRDLNEGKLPHYSGVSRIPRPKIRMNSSAPLDDICETDLNNSSLHRQSLIPPVSRNGGMVTAALNANGTSKLPPTNGSINKTLKAKNRPVSVMANSTKSRPTLVRPPSSMSKFSSEGSPKPIQGFKPIVNNHAISPIKNNYSSKKIDDPISLNGSIDIRSKDNTQGPIKENNSNVFISNSNALLLQRDSINNISSSDKAKEPLAFIKAPENNIQKLIELIGSRASPADFLRLNRISKDFTSENSSFRQFWLHSECLTRLIKACLFHIQKSDISWELREPGIVLLESLIKNQGQLIDSNISEILTALIECSRNPARNASSVAEDALIAFAQNIEVHSCITTTIRFLQACLLIEKGSLPELEDLATPTASGFLILVHAIPRLSPENLNDYKLDLDSLVGTGFNHNVSVVRHHTLTLVLAINNMLKPGNLESFFPRLTSAQLRLIDLYLESW